jgi:hypothetical protein
MRTVVIVLLDPASDALLGLVEALVLVEPHLLFFQAAMEPLDITVALGMVVSRAPVRDAQPIQGFDISCGRKLRAVVGRQSQTRSTRTERQSLQHGTVERRSSVRQRKLKSQPTISRVQQSMTETRYAQPTLGPAQTLVMSDCQT